jgi:hypothetical protein
MQVSNTAQTATGHDLVNEAAVYKRDRRSSAAGSKGKTATGGAAAAAGGKGKTATGGAAAAGGKGKRGLAGGVGVRSS